MRHTESKYFPNSALGVVKAVLLLTFSAAALSVSPLVYAQAVQGCGTLQNGYGPYDYTNPTHFRDKLEIVERAHYDQGVIALRGHRTKPNELAGDIDYTLRAFPNHHKALYTMIKYDQSPDPRHKPRMKYTPECYFQRAMVFQPNDGNVRLLYGIYKARINKIDEAKEEFSEAARLMPGSAEVYYNIGLMLAKNKDHDEAYEYAVKAYDLGYPLPGLKNILNEPASGPKLTRRLVNIWLKEPGHVT